MKLTSPITVLALVLMAACADDAGPSITTSDVRILAPMPGSSAGVAYLKIDNRSDAAITIRRIESPQYSDVQMHETTIADGISSMRAISSIVVEPRSNIEFTPGGRHIMLMRPLANVGPGSLVELEIQHDDGLLIVNATMQNRLPFN